MTRTSGSRQYYQQEARGEVQGWDSYSLPDTHGSDIDYALGARKRAQSLKDELVFETRHISAPSSLPNTSSTHSAYLRVVSSFDETVYIVIRRLRVDGYSILIVSFVFGHLFASSTNMSARKLAFPQSLEWQYICINVPQVRFFNMVCFLTPVYLTQCPTTNMIRTTEFCESGVKRSTLHKS
ncbi:hypothetical protein ABKN59_010576 [Abortiporus biennis]